MLKGIFPLSKRHLCRCNFLSLTRILLNATCYLALFLVSALLPGGPRLSESQANILIGFAIRLRMGPTDLFMIVVFIGHLLIALTAYLLIKMTISIYLRCRKPPAT